MCSCSTNKDYAILIGHATQYFSYHFLELFIDEPNSDKITSGEIPLMSGKKKGSRFSKENCERPCKEDDSVIRDSPEDYDEEKTEHASATVQDKSFIKKLYVHSQWLAVQSPYFKALFYSGMKESYTKDVVMKVYENEVEAHTTLIEAMYSLDALNGKDLRLVVKTFVLANKYDVSFVAKKCKYVLLSSTLDLET